MMRRLGALFAVGLVAMPIAYVVRDSDSTEQLQTATAEAAGPDGGVGVAAAPVAPVVAPAVVAAPEHGADPKLGRPCQAQNRCRPE